ncbi:MAG: chromate transporter [Methylocystaceae bacterium]
MGLGQAIWSFLRLGALTWGGGYAMLPGIQKECSKHNWVNETEFSDYLAIAQSAPGPVAGNMALLIGRHLAGWPGAIFCLISVSLPSLLITLVIAIFLLSSGLPGWARDMLYLLQPAIAGLVLATAWRLATDLERSLPTILIAIIGLIALEIGLHPALLLLLGGGTLMLLRRKRRQMHVE